MTPVSLLGAPDQTPVSQQREPGAAVGSQSTPLHPPVLIHADWHSASDPATFCLPSAYFVFACEVH